MYIPSDISDLTFSVILRSQSALQYLFNRWRRQVEKSDARQFGEASYTSCPFAEQMSISTPMPAPTIKRSCKKPKIYRSCLHSPMIIRSLKNIRNNWHPRLSRIAPLLQGYAPLQTNVNDAGTPSATLICSIWPKAATYQGAVTAVSSCQCFPRNSLRFFCLNTSMTLLHGNEAIRTSSINKQCGAICYHVWRLHLSLVSWW